MLPCGETICAKHEADFKGENFSCKFCENYHLETGPFLFSKTIQRLLERHVHELDFGEEHKSAMASLTNLKSSIQCYESFGKNAEVYIYEYFAKLRNDVDLKRETMIHKINNSSDELLSEIAALEMKCKENYIKSGLKLPKAEELVRIKSEVCEWEKSLEKLVVDDKQWKEIKKQCSNYKDKLEEDLKVLNDKLLSVVLKRKEIDEKFSNVESVLAQNLV
jgi:hypothetical protein